MNHDFEKVLQYYTGISPFITNVLPVSHQQQ